MPVFPQAGPFLSELAYDVVLEDVNFNRSFDNVVDDLKTYGLLVNGSMEDAIVVALKAFRQLDENLGDQFMTGALNQYITRESYYARYVGMLQRRDPDAFGSSLRSKLLTSAQYISLLRELGEKDVTNVLSDFDEMSSRFSFNSFAYEIYNLMLQFEMSERSKDLVKVVFAFFLAAAARTAGYIEALEDRVRRSGPSQPLISRLSPPSTLSRQTGAGTGDTFIQGSAVLPSRTLGSEGLILPRPLSIDTHNIDTRNTSPPRISRFGRRSPRVSRRASPGARSRSSSQTSAGSP